MKTKILALLVGVISIFDSSNVIAQCGTNTTFGSFCNTRSAIYSNQYNADLGCGVYRTITNYSPGTYFRMPVLEGGCYTIQTCGAPIDTQLGAFQGVNTTGPFAYNDDSGPACSGFQASMNITPNFTDYTRINVTQFNCLPGGSASITVRIRQNNNLSITSSALDMCQGQTRSLTALPARTIVTPLPGSGNRGTFTGSGVSGTTFTAPTPSGSSQLFTVAYTFGYCTSTQNIRVWRNPTVSNAGTNQNLLCGETATTLNANNPVYGNGVWTKISGPGTITNPNNRSSTVTGLVPGSPSVFRWTITNGPCNSSIDNVTINSFSDVTAPNAPVLANVTADCNTSLSTPFASDNCSGTVFGTTADTLNFVEGDSTLITWTFTDAVGNASTSTQWYNYDDQTAPVAPVLAADTVDCFGILAMPYAIDNCADSVMGTTSDALNFADGDSTLITWVFDDGNGNTDTTLQWYYYDDVTAPVTPTLASVSVDCNGTLTAPTTIDSCAGTITGTTSDVLNFVEGDSTLVTWTFDDGNGNSTTATQTYNYDDVTAPLAPALSSVTVDCNGILTVPSAIDNCAGVILGTTSDVLNFVDGGSTLITWSFDDGNGNISTAAQTYNYDDVTAPTAPTLADVTIDCNGSLITAPTAPDNCAGTVTGTTSDVLNFVEGGSTLVTWTFDDGNGNSSTSTQTYYYDDVTAPATPTLASVTVDCNGTLTAPTTTDDCAGTVTGTTSDVLNFVEGGSTVVTWTFDDGNGNSTTATQTYNYDDATAPATPSLASVTVDCNGTLTVPTTTDNCAGTVTGTTTDVLSFVEGGSTVVTWTFDDGNGNSTTATQTYNYDDATAPVTPTIASVTVDCNGTLTAPPTAVDNCAGTITGTTSGTLNFVEGDSTVITWSFDDGNGNTSTATQTYYYDDVNAPVAPTLTNVTVDCNGTLITAPTATDDCYGTVIGTTTGTLNFVDGDSTLITWTFDDGNGNTSTSTQWYFYDDVNAPATPTLTNVTVDCNGTLTAPTTTDDCAGTITGTTTGTLSFVEGDSTVITWTFDDGNGNSTTATQTYNYDDTTAPAAPTLANVTVDCNGTLAAAPTATDNCAGVITGTTTGTLIFVEGDSTVITWSFDDGNGNTSTASQTYLYDDTTAPVPDSASLADVSALCEVSSLTAPTATDDCAASVTVSNDANLPITTVGTTVVTWTYDDGNGNTITQTQNVIISGFDVTTTVVGATITSDQTGDTYQWIDCSTNAAIPGETNQSFTATANGDYAVIVSSGTCRDTSDCETIIVIGIDSRTTDLQLSIYPNPAYRGEFKINSNSEIQKVEIYNILGSQVSSQVLIDENNNVNASALESAEYILKIYTVDGIEIRKVIISH